MGAELIQPDTVPVPRFDTVPRQDLPEDAQLGSCYITMHALLMTEAHMRLGLEATSRVCNAKQMHVALCACRQSGRLEEQEIGASKPQRVLG